MQWHLDAYNGLVPCHVLTFLLLLHSWHGSLRFAQDVYFVGACAFLRVCVVCEDDPLHDGTRPRDVLV